VTANWHKHTVLPSTNNATRQLDL